MYIKKCSDYRDLNEMVESTMSILNEEFHIPKNLTDKIMAKRPQIQQPKIRKFNYAVYAQIAAVIAAGVFMGVMLGKNADTGLLLSKETKKQRSLIEYRDSHHLNIDHTYFLK